MQIMDCLFSYVSKNSSNIVKSRNLNHGVYIDTSGSTCHYTNSKGEKYIDLELEILHIIKKKSIPAAVVGWSNNATVAVNGQFKIERGGTSPSCIFNNSESAQIFDRSNIIVFLTDGEISQSNVAHFAERCKGKLQKTLILCGLISANKGVNSNISVFAPLFDSPNVICFQYDGEVTNKTTILMSKGSISSTIPVEKNVHLEDLFDLSISDAYANIPKENLVCNETDDEIMSVNLEAFVDYVKSPKCTWEAISTHVEKMDWSSLLRNAKVTNTTNTIRDVINKLKHLQSEYIKSLVKTDNAMPYCAKRDMLVAQIVEMKNNNIDYSHLRAELNEYINKARIEEHEFTANIQLRMTNGTKIWDSIKAELYELEKGSYSLNDFVFSSNRAKRAKETNSQEISELEAILIHDNVPEVECCIHLDKGPAILWLQSPENKDEATTDYCINFPLHSYPKLQQSLVVNPVCGDCAQGYMNASSNKYGKKLKSVYNVPIHGYIPLNFSRNNKFITYTLCNILCGGKILNHIKSLLLSITDDNNEEWFQPIKDHIIHELINCIYTTDTFTEEGTKMPMIEALKKLHMNEQALLSQPLISSYRLLRMHYLYGNGNNKNIQTMAKRRFSYFLIEHRSSSIKPHGDRDEEFSLYYNYEEKLNTLLFDTYCGIPIEGTTRNINMESMNTLLKLDWDQIYNAVYNLSKLLDIEPQSLINQEFLTYIVYGISCFTKYEKPMVTFTKLLGNKFFLNAEHQTDSTKILTNINTDRFKYFKPKTTHVPCYGFYNGVNSTPSKLYFNKTPLWDTEMVGQVFTLGTLANQLNENLGKKLREWYGSVVPDSKSAHTNLHRIVATVLENKFPNENNTNNPDIVDSMVMACLDYLKQTRGEKGNMYNIHNMYSYVYAIYDFCELRSKYKPTNFVEEQSNLYNIKKLRIELENNNIEINDFDQLTFVDENFKPPLFMEEKFSELNIFEILSRVNEKYTLQNKNYAKTKKEFSNIVTIYNDDIIDINIPNVTTDAWNNEQLDVVSKISMNDSVNFDQIKYYAGADISFHKDDNNKAVACFVIFENATDKVVGEVTVKCKTNMPYKAGYLAFREAPILLKLLDIVKQECPEIMPELIIFDGNGIWHPRGCGIATHFSVLSGIPAFGVAKKVLVVPGVTRESVYELVEKNASLANSMVDIKKDDGTVIGAAYNTTGTVKSSIFLSPGNGISLDTVKNITRRVTSHTVTEPIRKADLLSRKILAQL